MCAVDDVAGLDRLDGWLNGQRGWRRRLLLWLDAYPWAFIVSVALWAWWAFEPDGGLTVVAAVAVGLPVAVPLVFVGFGLHAMRAGTARKPPRAWTRLSWRWMAFGFLAGVDVALECVVFSDFWYRRVQEAHLLGNWITSFIGVGCLGLLLAEDRYARQVARRRAATPGLRACRH